MGKISNLGNVDFGNVVTSGIFLIEYIFSDYVFKIKT